MAPLYLHHCSSPYLPPYPSRQPTLPLTPTRTHDTRRICPPFSRSNGSANKNSRRKTESAVHNAWQILRKPSMALLYMPGLKMVDHPPSTNSNRVFHGPSLLSSPKFFQSLTSRVSAARLARASNSIAALLVFGLVLMQVMWWSFMQVIAFSLKQATLRTPWNSTSTFMPARMRPCHIYVTTFLERERVRS